MKKYFFHYIHELHFEGKSNKELSVNHLIAKRYHWKSAMDHDKYKNKAFDTY